MADEALTDFDKGNLRRLLGAIGELAKRHPLSSDDQAKVKRYAELAGHEPAKAGRTPSVKAAGVGLS